MNSAVFVQNLKVESNGVECEETLALVTDVRDVWSSLYQVMPVIGPWFEARVAWLISKWLPQWRVGSGQVYDPSRPGMRSRSWDIIVYKDRQNAEGLPPAPYPGGMRPLVPKPDCCAVIDTKTTVSEIRDYAGKPAFNLMNDCEVNQLEFLGDGISKFIFACMTSSNPETMEQMGRRFGISVFILGKYLASAVSDAEERKLVWRLSSQHDSALLRFRKELVDSAERWVKNRET